MRTLVLGLLFVVAVPTTFGQCERKVDEFTGSKGVLCDKFEVTVESQPQNHIWKTTGRLFQAKGQTAIVLTVYADGWNFLRVSKADALIDGNRHTFRVGSFRTNVEGASVMRQLGIMLTEEALSGLIGAKSVRIRLGDGVFRFPADSLSRQARALTQ